MHFARLEKSDRLRRVLALLSDGRPRTTREIVRMADVCAVNSIVSELRANLYDIRCKCIGKGVFEYWLVGRLPEPEEDEDDEYLDEWSF